MLNHSVNFTVSLNTGHQRQRGRQLGSENEDENHNTCAQTDICSYVKVLAAKLQDELQKVAVVGFVVTVQYHNISNPTVGCVVFIITSFHKTLMTLMTNWDLMKLNDFLLNW